MVKTIRQLFEDYEKDPELVPEDIRTSVAVAYQARQLAYDSWENLQTVFHEATIDMENLERAQTKEVTIHDSSVDDRD